MNLPFKLKTLDMKTKFKPNSRYQQVDIFADLHVVSHDFQVTLKVLNGRVIHKISVAGHPNSAFKSLSYNFGLLRLHVQRLCKPLLTFLALFTFLSAAGSGNCHYLIIISSNSK